MAQVVDNVSDKIMSHIPNGNGHANPSEGTADRLQVINDQKSFTYVTLDVTFAHIIERLLGKN